MLPDNNSLATLFLVFLPLSLTAFGGGISILPAMQHQSVDVYHWVTGAECLALFAISNRPLIWLCKPLSIALR